MGLVMKRHGFTLWEALVTLIVLVVLAAILFPTDMHSTRGNAYRASCQSNLKQFSLAIAQYSQDYDNRWPSVTVKSVAQSLPPYSTPYGWADAVYSYAMELTIYQCKADDSGMNNTQDAAQDNFIDYYFNANLSTQPEREVNLKAKTIMLGEGRDGVDRTDARYAHQSLPQRWIKDENSPAQRHLGGANYAFADGHVKWLLPEKVKAIRTNESDYSFAVK